MSNANPSHKWLGYFQTACTPARVSEKLPAVQAAKAAFSIKSGVFAKKCKDNRPASACFFVFTALEMKTTALRFSLGAVRFKNTAVVFVSCAVHLVLPAVVLDLCAVYLPPTAGFFPNTAGFWVS